MSATSFSISRKEAEAVVDILSGFTLIERDDCFQYWNEDRRASLFISKTADVLFPELVAFSYESSNSTDRWKTLIKPDAESVKSTLLSFCYERLLRRSNES
jgi:hypothetical protein